MGRNAGLGIDAQFGAGFFFAANIDLGSRVFAHAHERQAGGDAPLFQVSNMLRQSGQNACRNGAAINDDVWAG